VYSELCRREHSSRRLQQILQRENSRKLDDTASTINRRELEFEMLETVDKLINIKTAIAKANINIYSKIERMSELKSLIVFYSSLNTKHGSYDESDYDKERIVQYDALYKQEDVDKKIKELKSQIEELQDEIDEYNSRTMIKLDN